MRYTGKAKRPNGVHPDIHWLVFRPARVKDSILFGTALIEQIDM